MPWSLDTAASMPDRDVTNRYRCGERIVAFAQPSKPLAAPF